MSGPFSKEQPNILLLFQKLSFQLKSANIRYIKKKLYLLSTHFKLIFHQIKSSLIEFNVKNSDFFINFLKIP